MQEVVEEGEGFEDVSPVLSLVVETFVDHLNDLDKVVSAGDERRGVTSGTVSLVRDLKRSSTGLATV